MAQENSISDQEFMKELNGIKNPFEEGIPKPIIVPNTIKIKTPPRVNIIQNITPSIKKREVAKPVVVHLPSLSLQGIIFGGDVHQVIINNQIVPLQGTIEGAKVNAITKSGVELIYKGKKFFLKVD